jgi:hypothetical protein
MEIDLFMICVSSFVGVFFVLTFLAISMRLIIIIFPEKKEVPRDDAPLYAAISSIYAQRFPGTRIGTIEEIKNNK